MRKIQVLKALVDFIWIVSMPFIPIALLLIPFMFLYTDLGVFHININGIKIEIIDFPSKILGSIAIITGLLAIYVLYLFRKMLRYFLNMKIFDNHVITSFNKIGGLLIIIGFISVALSISAKLYLNQSFSLNIGLNANIITLASGIFFLILSEVFKIANTMKQENELTI